MGPTSGQARWGMAWFLVAVLIAVLFFVPNRYRSLAGWISYRAAPGVPAQKHVASEPTPSGLSPQERQTRRQELLNARADDPNAHWQVARLFYEDGAYAKAMFHVSEAARLGFMVDAPEERNFVQAVRHALEQPAN